MLFKICDYLVNIDACDIHRDKENTKIKDVKFNERDTMYFVNHINTYICTFHESELRTQIFSDIFDQLAAYGFFGKDLQKIYSK